MSVKSSSNSSFYLLRDECSVSVCASLFTALFISYVLLLPVSIFVLYVGYQRWRRQRSVATATTTSHSDIFTFNMVALELITVLGCCFFCYGIYTAHQTVLALGLSIYSIISPGQTLFHLLTCVDRYLAVVHPVTYLGLRQAGGVRIRNVSIGCVWLLCLGSLCLSAATDYFNFFYCFVLLVLSSLVVSYCSFSVLCVLTRPGPGEVSGNRKQVDQSKQRAFYTVMAITGALLLRCLSSLVSIVMNKTSVANMCEICLVLWSTGWISLPSSLILPLLFLHRAGKLAGFKHNTASG